MFGNFLPSGSCSASASSMRIQIQESAIRINADLDPHRRCMYSILYICTKIQKYSCWGILRCYSNNIKGWKTLCGSLENKTAVLYKICTGFRKISISVNIYWRLTEYSLKLKYLQYFIYQCAVDVKLDTWKKEKVIRPQKRCFFFVWNFFCLSPQLPSMLDTSASSMIIRYWRLWLWQESY